MNKLTTIQKDSIDTIIDFLKYANKTANVFNIKILTEEQRVKLLDILLHIYNIIPTSNHLSFDNNMLCLNGEQYVYTNLLTDIGEVKYRNKTIYELSTVNLCNNIINASDSKNKYVEIGRHLLIFKIN